MSCCGKKAVEFDESEALKPFAGEVYTERVLDLNGHKRNVISWLPDQYNKPFQEIRGLILISHGLHEHALRYYEVAHAFTARGFAVYGLDFEGHGKSDGVRGFIEDYNNLVQDLVMFAGMVRAEQKTGLPTFLVCHSMGTVVSILALQKIPDLVAVIFSGCALCTGPASASPFGVKMLYPLSQTSAALKLSSFMAAVAPKGAAAPILLDAFSSDEAERKLVLRDPRRVDGSVLNKTAYEFLKMVAAAKAALPSLKTPFLCLHGEADQIAYPKGSQLLFDTAGTDASQKRIEIIPGLRHEVYHERKPEGPQNILKAVDYFESFLNRT